MEAADAQSLRGIQDIITHDLDRFGHREHLTITWQQPDTVYRRPAGAGTRCC